MSRYLQVLFIILILSGPVYAQVSTGTILGVVQDSSGAVIPGVSVTVKNLNTSDVTVYANINGSQQRLGTVSSQQTANFQLDWGRIGPSGRVSMVVDQIGSSGGYRSGAVTMRPGAQITVNVAPSIRNSTTQVY